MDRWEEKENREFLRAGTIAAAVLNPWRGDDRKHRPYTAYDFFHIPRPEISKPKLTPAQIKANAERVFSLHNARVRRLERGKKKRA